MLTSRITLDSVVGQTNSTTNQTSTPTATPAMTTSVQDEAEPIKGAMTETREFLGNVTESCYVKIRRNNRK